MCHCVLRGIVSLCDPLILLFDGRKHENMFLVHFNTAIQKRRKNMISRVKEVLTWTKLNIRNYKLKISEDWNS